MSGKFIVGMIFAYKQAKRMRIRFLVPQGVSGLYSVTDDISDAHKFPTKASAMRELRRFMNVIGATNTKGKRYAFGVAQLPISKSDFYSKLVASLVRKNPVPELRRSSLEKAHKLYEDFRGDSAVGVQRVRVPGLKVGLVVGELDGVLYTTIRDGKRESYIHKFRKKSRPLLVSSHDGKSIHIISGKYEFTERGIVDR